MEFFRIKKDIPFMRHALIFNVISALTFAAAVFFLLHRGLHLSIEFTGGTVMEVAYTQPANIEGVREKIAELGYTDMQVQSFGTAQRRADSPACAKERRFGAVERTCDRCAEGAG
jgi:preprotein translocase subunit SecF